MLQDVLRGSSLYGSCLLVSRLRCWRHTACRPPGTNSECSGLSPIGIVMGTLWWVSSWWLSCLSSPFRFRLFVDGILLPNQLVEKGAKMHLPAFGAGIDFAEGLRFRSQLVLVLVCTLLNVTPSVRTWVFTQKQAVYFVVKGSTSPSMSCMFQSMVLSMAACGCPV